MWKITENLYLAQLPIIDGPTRKQELKKNNVTRVLTVTTEPISDAQKIEGIQYHFLHMFDMPSQEILANGILEQSINYIEESVANNENIVVHCLAAVSRSVTICVAYLMLKNQWSLEKALKMVQSIRKPAEPNSGFLAQLKIWERSAMTFPSDAPKLYQDLQMEIPGVADVDAKTIWRQPVIDDRAKLRFKCRSCRKLLFNADNITHCTSEACQKYLVEPMTWLTVSDAQCSVSHSCGAKLGNFIANGAKCNGCAKFVKQWILIDKSKIDRVEPVG
uniref:protein-tyrosine-phosphatase n=1 Tax=Caenorhabditis japonica TaxID=281687 RepID=A0A8R1HQR3_CAEJA